MCKPTALFITVFVLSATFLTFRMQNEELQNEHKVENLLLQATVDCAFNLCTILLRYDVIR